MHQVDYCFDLFLFSDERRRENLPKLFVARPESTPLINRSDDGPGDRAIKAVQSMSRKLLEQYFTQCRSVLDGLEGVSLLEWCRLEQTILSRFQ